MFCFLFLSFKQVSSFDTHVILTGLFVTLFKFFKLTQFYSISHNFFKCTKLADLDFTFKKSIPCLQNRLNQKKRETERKKEKSTLNTQNGAGKTPKVREMTRSGMGVGKLR